MRRLTGISLSVAVALVCCAPARAADDPLAWVPSNAGFFAHLRVNELWNSPVGKEVRKSAAEQLKLPLEELKKQTGIDLETVDTATFLFPNMPQGPGDEQTFVILVTTTKPYDRDVLLKDLREDDAKVEDNAIALKQKFTLRFVSDTMFVVLHDSQKAKFAKGPPQDDRKGVMAEALKLAADKHQFVWSLDFSKLPNELFTAAPPQLQPFLPILKSKSAVLFADLKEKDLSVGARFAAENAAAAEDAERSFKLLMSLASAGLILGIKEVEKDEKAKFALPVIKEVKRGVDEIKIAREGERLNVDLALKADMPIDKLIAEATRSITGSADSAQEQNNLKQVGLAMHTFHDTNGALPPAAICDKKGRPLLSWRVAVLPYIEQQQLYNEFHLDEPWDSEHNKKLIAKMPRIYAVPGAKNEDGKTHIRVFVGNGAAFDMVESFKLQDIVDGTSNTIMCVESAEAVEWTKPDDLEFAEKLNFEKLLRWVDGRTQVAFCDGSVRTLTKKVSDKTWRNLIQRNDGNVVNIEE